MTKVELEKVDASHDCVVSTRITKFNENEEHEGDEEEERSEEGKSKSSAGRCPDGRGRGM